MNLLKKWIFKENDNVDKSSLIWNTIASGINASESIVILMVAARIVDIQDVGILTFSFIVANFMMFVGKYGVRNYQVTDTNNMYAFGDYLKSRYMSLLIMIFAITFFSFYAIFLVGYSKYKITTMMLVIAIYAVEVYEDVYIAEVQRLGRLDIGAKVFSFRWFVVLLIWALGIVSFGEILVPTVLALVVNIITMVIMVKWLRKYIGDRYSISTDDFSGCKNILKNCGPLCITGALAMYITNAAKYAIDACLSDADQAYYGFISISILVISLLTGIIFEPILFKMAVEWNTNNIKVFCLYIKKISILIISISFFVIVGAYFLGIPTLSFVYSTDLSGLKREMMILLFGGAVWAFVGMFGAVITIMRKQKIMMVLYLIVSCCGLLSFQCIIRNFGLLGAALANTGLIVVLAIALGIYIWCEIRKKIKYPCSNVNKMLS